MSNVRYLLYTFYRLKCNINFEFYCQDLLMFVRDYKQIVDFEPVIILRIPKCDHLKRKTNGLSFGWIRYLLPLIKYTEIRNCFTVQLRKLYVDLSHNFRYIVCTQIFDLIVQRVFACLQVTVFNTTVTHNVKASQLTTKWLQMLQNVLHIKYIFYLPCN